MHTAALKRLPLHVAQTTRRTRHASATITSASCNGGTDGSISVVASGGDGNYTYLWSNNAATPTLTGLPAGPIGLTLTDGAGCTRSFSYIINQNSSMSVQSLTAADVQCNGGSDGQFPWKYQVENLGIYLFMVK